MIQNANLLLRQFSVVVSLVSVLAPQVVAMEQTKEVQRWLERMTQAVKDKTYEGVFVYLHGQQLEAMHISHKVESGREQERIISLNGTAREVLRDDDTVTCIMPEARLVSVDKQISRKQFPVVLPMNLEALTQHYSFHILGKNRVAGRSAQVIAIIPRDTYRYGYRLFLDEHTALPLKTDMMDEFGKPIAQLMFTSLEVRDNNPSPRPQVQTQQQLPQGFRKSSRRVDKVETKSRSWDFSQLPVGFSVSSHSRWKNTADGSRVEQFVISDGLASMSVYVERGSTQIEGLKGGTQLGAVNAWGRPLAGYHITAMGEVPAKTVRLAVDHLEYVRGD